MGGGPNGYVVRDHSYVHEEREGGRYISRRSKGGYVILQYYRSGHNTDKGEGVKNPENFVDVLYEWSLTKVVLNLV